MFTLTIARQRRSSLHSSHCVLNALLCLVVFIAINTTDTGAAPTTGTRTAIELIGGGKIKKRLPEAIGVRTPAI